MGLARLVCGNFCWAVSHLRSECSKTPRRPLKWGDSVAASAQACFDCFVYCNREGGLTTLHVRPTFGFRGESRRCGQKKGVHAGVHKPRMSLSNVAVEDAKLHTSRCFEGATSFCTAAYHALTKQSC